MEFYTNNVNCLFPFGERELSFLLYKIIEVESKEYGSFDPIGTIYRNILETHLMLNEKKTIEFIVGIEQDERFDIVASSFPILSGTFQSTVFLEQIGNATNKFKESNLYRRFAKNILEAKKALDEI